MRIRLQHFPDHQAWAFVDDDPSDDTRDGTYGVIVPADAGLNLLHDTREDAVAEASASGMMVAADGRCYALVFNDEPRSY